MACGETSSCLFAMLLFVGETLVEEGPGVRREQTLGSCVKFDIMSFSFQKFFCLFVLAL